MENNNYSYEIFNKHSIAVYTPKFKNWQILFNMLAVEWESNF